RIPPARQRFAWWHASEDVVIAVTLVDYEPGGDVWFVVGVLVVHRMHGVDIRRCLVDKSLAGRVDQDAAGQRTLGQAEERPAGQRDRRAPPGIIHQVKGGSGLLAGDDAITVVARRADGPVRADGLPLVLGAHGGVSLEATGGDQHAAARA